ncbi:MAG TPA: secondary thiamine-phosphate synthase enzyme YjbQ [Rhizomicrobium sp.]
MKQHFSTIRVNTRGVGTYEFTGQAESFVRESEIQQGLLTCFVRHTSASLIIQENADPDVQRDLESFLDRLVSRDETLYRHTTEGPDDMPSHIRSMLTQTSLSIPVQNGQMILGTWQGLYLFEHRDAPHSREIALHIIGA